MPKMMHDACWASIVGPELVGAQPICQRARPPRERERERERERQRLKLCPMAWEPVQPSTDFGTGDGTWSTGRKYPPPQQTAGRREEGGGVGHHGDTLRTLGH